MAGIKKENLFLSTFLWAIVGSAISLIITSKPSGIFLFVFIASLVTFLILFGFRIDGHSVLSRWLTIKKERETQATEHHTANKDAANDIHNNRYTGESTPGRTQKRPETAEDQQAAYFTALEKDDHPDVSSLLEDIKEGLALEKLEESIADAHARGIINIQQKMKSLAATESEIKNGLLKKAMAIEELKEIHQDIFNHIIRIQGLADDDEKLSEEKLSAIIDHCIVETTASFKKQIAFTYRIYLAAKFNDELNFVLDKTTRE